MKLIFSGFSLITLYLFSGCNDGSDNSKVSGKDDSSSAQSSATVKGLQESLKEHPDSAGLRYRLVEELNRAGNYKEALKQSDSLLQQDSTNPAFWYKRGQILAVSGDSVKAIGALKISIDRAPLFMEPQLLLAAIYANRNNPVALKIADHIVQSSEDPRTETQARFIKGLYYSNINDKPAALRQFDSCIVNDYSFLDAYVEKGLVLYDQKDYAGALKVFEKSIEVSNTFAEAYYQAGRCEEALGNKEEAVNYYKKALGLDKTLEAAAKALQRLKT
jgi:tetratricopeptide (TPR) repeat protein